MCYLLEQLLDVWHFKLHKTFAFKHAQCLVLQYFTQLHLMKPCLVVVAALKEISSCGTFFASRNLLLLT